METVSLTCENCGGQFARLAKEYRRCVKRGYGVSCSRSCGAALRNRKCSKGNPEHLKADNRQDEYSPFRYYVNKSRSGERRRAYGEGDITVEYLKALWEQQRGICPYTGLLMELPKNTQDHHIKGSPYKASLDRIDSSLGYVEGNVEFVCLAVNYAKNGFTKEQMLEFFSKISI